jgi:predicted acyltransferase
MGKSSRLAMRERESRRIASIDVYRGLTIAGMILVTNPGTYSAVYPPLLHAAWNGVTATDIIFPSFLFIVGMVLPFAVESRMERGATDRTITWHLLKRSAIMVALGLAVNGFPDYHWSTLRWPGILQRIAICYLAAGWLYLATRRSTRLQSGRRFDIQSISLGGLALLLLVIYGVLIKVVPVPGIGAGHLDTYRSLPAFIDRSIIGIPHMWIWGLTPGMGVTYDPEGILSTLPAMANTLLGLCTGIFLTRHRVTLRSALLLALTGALLATCGWLLDPVLPLNKRLWTSSFAVFSGGISLFLFSLLYIIVDLWRSRWWTIPPLILGTNAILAFVLSGVITASTDNISMNNKETLHAWVYGHIFAPLLSPRNASLAYAVTIVLLNIVLILPLYRKRIFLRI